MLRAKYLARVKPQHATFHSIVLAGVHDIKSLKHKIRDTDDSQYNSPWNIAADFEVDMNFGKNFRFILGSLGMYGNIASRYILPGFFQDRNNIVTTTRGSAQ